MGLNNFIVELFPFLMGLEYKEFLFHSQEKISLAEVVVNANLPYRPGIYLVFDYSGNKLKKILYVGQAGADKNGNLNSHQIPKRLLAVNYPPTRYLNIIKDKNPNRNVAWPKMMEIDKIETIKIYCFFSPIDDHFKVQKTKIPLKLEKSIIAILKEKKIKLPWSKRYA